MTLCNLKQHLEILTISEYAFLEAVPSAIPQCKVCQSVAYEFFGMSKAGVDKK